MRIDYADGSRAQKHERFQHHALVIALIVVLVAVFLWGCTAVGDWANEPLAPQPVDERLEEPNPTAPTIGIPGGEGPAIPVTLGTGIEIPLPGGLRIVVPSIPSEPRVYEVAGLGTVTLRPSSEPPGYTLEVAPPKPADRPNGPTKGDATAGAIGGVVGTLTGNPILGQLVIGGLGALLASIPRRKKGGQLSLATS